MRFIFILTFLSFLTGCNYQTQVSPSASNQQTHTANATQARSTVVGDLSAIPSPFDQRVVTDPNTIARTKLSTAKRGPAATLQDEKLRPIALFYGPLPTGVTVSQEGRMFVSFPRWELPVSYTVAEIANGQLKPFPDPQTNQFNPANPQDQDPRTHLVSVQSVMCDSANRLWLLDSGSINMQPIIDGAAKMWAYDLQTRQRVKEITFGDAVKKNTYLNDVRFDLKRGAQGTAYITDSGAGGIIVVDLASGQAWRKLDGHPSVMADKSLTLVVESTPLKKRSAIGEEKPVQVNSDGIALSPDGKTLYYAALTGHTIYSVSTDFLANRTASGTDADKAVQKIAEKFSANDGMICDAKGRIYTADFEDGVIRRFTPSETTKPAESNVTQLDNEAKSQIIVQDERLLWPDTMAIHNGKLFVTSNQLNRQAAYNGGQTQLEPPFAIFEYPIDER
jgi:sugar lactone lactonase YvrE